MPSQSGLAALAEGAILSPFTQLRRLLDGMEPGHAKPIDLTVGEPREAMPAFVAAKLTEAMADYGRYPPIRGTQELRAAIAAWAGRRYGAAAAPDAAREVLPLNGSREGLFLAALPAAGRKQVRAAPPCSCAIPTTAPTSGAPSRSMPSRSISTPPRRRGICPTSKRSLPTRPCSIAPSRSTCARPRTRRVRLPAAAYIARALQLARAHDFMLFFDECYSEIYTSEPPTGALAVAAATPERFRNLVVFNSLSKRSNLPGLRSGFCAGDARFIETFAEIRNMVAPQVPGPTQHVSAAVWADEAHVAANRDAYRAKFDVCDRVLGTRYGYRRPAGGFCLWLDVSNFGGGSDAAVTLWKRGGVKVLPGAFLAQAGRDGTNPGTNYVRLALVHDATTIAEALERLVVVFA